MSTAFDDVDVCYRVLVNGDGQHSLWPDFAEVPTGWHEVFGPASPQHCFEFIEAHWRNLGALGKAAS